MYKKQTLKRLSLNFFIVAGLLAGLFSVVLSMSVSAASCGGVEYDPKSENCCGGVVTSVLDCDQAGTSGNISDTGLWGLLILVINLLSAGVGVLAVGGIVYGSILYTTSSGDPEKSTKARKIIGNVVVGLIAYALMWALLNFITPGGLFA